MVVGQLAPKNGFNHTSRMVVITPIDRATSVGNRCEIEVLEALMYCYLAFWFSDGMWEFVIGLIQIPSFFYRSGGGRVVKLLACGARVPGFDSPHRHLNFRDWLSPASKSLYGWNTASVVNPQYNHPTNYFSISSLNRKGLKLYSMLV